MCAWRGAVIEGAICKTLQAMDTRGDVTMFGTGKPVRQFIYNYDLARYVIVGGATPAASVSFQQPTPGAWGIVLFRT